ncbi:hypothetical protein Tco_0903951 [Tanacetum coccineum]
MWSLDYLSISVPSKGRYKTTPPSPNVIVQNVVSVFPELTIDHYISHDRVMHPFASHYKRKTRLDHGKKRPRESNASSSSTTLNHPSSSRLLDDTIDANDDESFHSNSSFPFQNVFSSSNVVPIVCQNPPHESHNLNTYISETINLQLNNEMLTGKGYGQLDKLSRT